ncbi:DUF6671 family protein [Alteromonas sp. CYL-A6]|uniref:DUF6671 family protein n=1 Tax=Alteromonas nitratireducens TaxID=3390813 RepID=UPI0034AAE9E0
MTDIVLLTQHNKATQIAPVLAPLGYHVHEYHDFDTDTLGTFSGEIPRRHSPRDAALIKARTASELSGCDYGLGSEGTFGGGPLPGLANWNEEILCLFHAPSGHTVFASAAQPVSIGTLVADSVSALREKLAEAGEQRWMVSLDGSLKKALTASEVLALNDTQTIAWPLTLTPDFRALYCPQRQQTLAACAEDLARRLQARCPQCGHANFVIKAQHPGLPCEQCHLPTPQIKRTVTRCDNCEYEVATTHDAFAGAFYCPHCNP